MPKTELFGTAACPYTQEMREWLEWHGLPTVALLGWGGGEILRRNVVDHPLVVRSHYIPRIQEVQASVYHTIRELLETHRDA